MTYLMPGTVRDVSATLVARTILRPVCCWNTRCCSACESRAYSGSTSVDRYRFLVSASAVSRISRSPERKMRMSPGPSAISSSTASVIAVIWSRSASSESSSSSGRYRTSTGYVRPLTSTIGASSKCREKRSGSMVAEVMTTLRSGRLGRSWAR